MKRRILLLPVLLLGVTTVAQSFPYPTIRDVNDSDPLFRQLQDDIAVFHRNFANRLPLPALSIYRYRVRGTADIFALAARFNLGIQTLATINGAPNREALEEKTEILIPNLPGIYVPIPPKTDLERLIASSYPEELSAAEEFVVFTPDRRLFRLLPGESFTPLQISFFLGILYRFPLPSGTVSSEYGPRSDPFTGSTRFHGGVDIAAPIGTSVYASRGGVIVAAGSDPILGLHCVVSHEAGYSTVYGHLSRLFVELRQEVNSGSLIGAVGSTGRSTGPHLHFEIRSSDQTRDPGLFLPIPEPNE